MAKYKSKSKATSAAKLTPLEEYLSICNSEAKVKLLQQKYSDDEIQLFIHEVKSQRDAIDTDNLFDIGVLEQLADLHIQINRMSILQKQLMDESYEMKKSDIPGNADLSRTLQLEAVKLTKQINDCTDKCKSLITILDQAREQRAKRNEAQNINFTKIVRDLDDISYQRRIGEHGDLLARSLNRKKKEMKEQGLIMSTDAISEETVGQELSQDASSENTEISPKTEKATS